MARGFSLLETLIALLLVGLAMTALVLTFVGSSQFGVLSRRQATATMLARSLAAQLSHAPWSDARLLNNNTSNDATFTDPSGLFAKTALPTGTDAPDSSLGTFTVGDEQFDAYVNIQPQMDPVNTTTEMGRMIAIIVRYKVGTRFMRAVALGYRYNPGAVGVGQLPI